MVNSLSNPVYVDGTYGKFKYHAQPFQFGATEFGGTEDFSAMLRTDAVGRFAACRELRSLPHGSKFHRLQLPQYWRGAGRI